MYLASCPAKCGLTFLMVAISGCTGRNLSARSDVRKASQSEGHWVTDARLRDAMRDIDRLSMTSWPQEVETEFSQVDAYASAKAFWEARQLAEGLRAAAERIPELVSHIKMSAADRRSFEALVHTLRDQSDELKERAALGDRSGMRTALASIDATCNSCHVRFRDFAGPLNDAEVRTSDNR